MEAVLREVRRMLEARQTDDSCVMMKYILRFECRDGFRVNSPSHVGVSGRTNHVPGKSLVIHSPSGEYFTVTYYPTACAGSNGYVSMQLLIAGDKQDTDEAHRLLWDIFIQPPFNSVLSTLRAISAEYHAAGDEKPGFIAGLAITESGYRVIDVIDRVVAFHDGHATIEETMETILGARAVYAIEPVPVVLFSEINRRVLSVSRHSTPQVFATAHSMYRVNMYCSNTDVYEPAYIAHLLELSRALNQQMPFEPSRIACTVSNIQMRIMARPSVFIDVRVFSNPYVPVGMRNLPRAAQRAGRESKMHYRIFQPEEDGSFIGVNFIGGRPADPVWTTEIPGKPHRFITVGATSTEMARAVIYAVAMALIATQGAILLSTTDGVYDPEHPGCTYRAWEPGVFTDTHGNPIAQLSPGDIFVSAVYDEPPSALVSHISARMQSGETLLLRRKRAKRVRVAVKTESADSSARKYIKTE